MARKYSVKSRYYKKANYSHENKGFAFNVSGEAVNGLRQAGTLIVPASDSQGTRTIKGLTISLADQASAVPLYWALVYVPQGTTASPLFNVSGTPETGSLYEPNQYVMASGILDNDSGPHRISSKIARKLHSGDFISLVVGFLPASGDATRVQGVISYSVKYN